MFNHKKENPANIQLHLSEDLVTVQASKDYKIHFTGTDRPQVIDDNMHIRTPLTDCTVTLSFLTENEKTGERAATDLQLQIPGQYRNCRNTLAVPCMQIGSAVNAVHADIYALTLRS